MPARERRRGPGGRVIARALAALVAASLLPACAVDLDGAPCSTPGVVGSCPGGQACGNDHRCSARALACAATRCAPGAGGACEDPDGLPTTGVAHRCTAADPVCGSMIYDPCTPQGLSCAVRTTAAGAGAWCVCPGQPAGSRELLVSPQGSDRASDPPFPTGAASPAVCSFRRLSDALGAAAAIVADPLAVATVTATGAGIDPATATTVRYSASRGEAFPLVIPDRVTLRSDAPAGGGTYRIEFDPSPGVSALAPVELHAGGALVGFTVANTSGVGTQDAIAPSCDGRTAPVRLQSVVLDGGGTLGHGVTLDDSCGVDATQVQVRSFSGAGIEIVSTAGAQLGLTGGSVTGCQDGVHVKDGRLFLSGARVAGNRGMGIRGNYDPPGFSGAPRVEIRSSKIVGNGDSGIVLFNAAEVRITGTTVFSNGAQTGYGGSLVSSKVSRPSGGVVLFGTPPAAGSFEFGRNRIYANKGDQLLTIGTPSTWVLDGAGCGSDASGPVYTVIGCYDPATPDPEFQPSTSYRGIVAINAGTSARSMWWESQSPSHTWDWETFPLGGSTIDVTGWCTDPSTLSCASEDPIP